MVARSSAHPWNGRSNIILKFKDFSFLEELRKNTFVMWEAFFFRLNCFSYPYTLPSVHRWHIRSKTAGRVLRFYREILMTYFDFHIFHFTVELITSHFFDSIDKTFFNFTHLPLQEIPFGEKDYFAHFHMGNRP